ncbi:sensor histidine kinase [Cellulomonas hominis]
MGSWARVVEWAERHRFALDATATVVTLLVVVPISGLATGFRGTATFGQQATWAFLLVAPLAWRRARPAASAATVYTVALAHLLLGIPFVLPADLAVLVALYSVTVHGPRWAHRTAIGGALVGSAVLAASIGLSQGYYDRGGLLAIAMFTAAFSVATWAFGLMRRSRRETIEALVDRAQQLEIERDQQAQIATAAERTRIAREMHDIVAHSLTVIVAQADGGRYAGQQDPAAATRALGTIGETGRAALSDMRRLLGVLRTPEPAPGGSRSGISGGTAIAGPGATGAGGPAGPPGAAAPAYSPQPAERDLESLVEQMRASGMRVSLVRMGAPRRLPPGAGLTVYRICQEALTNVLKHAGPDPAVTVLVQWLPAALVLEVSDDGRGAAADSDGLGQGLLGMRERATMFGGTATAGPRPGGGFRVRARLPLPEARPQGGAAGSAPGAHRRATTSSTTDLPFTPTDGNRR